MEKMMDSLFPDGLVFSPAVIKFFQVVFIDVALAGDNALLVGLAVAGLPAGQRRKAVFWGIAIATGIRVAAGLLALQLLEIIGLTLAGGLLLLWVCWRMYRELRRQEPHLEASPPTKTMRQAMTQIVLADLSMSLDNVLAVAGAAEGHPYILMAGLVLSVLLMGVVANALANLLSRYRWIAWVGLAVVLYVALKMIWDGVQEFSDTKPDVPLWVPMWLRHGIGQLHQLVAG
ncbi:Integral membrane protein [Granulibacter bethesdensis]|uniref:Integral membrane protein n=2 Tax=Granulibacter bethesdensis TaxID=364410 RepID=A0AAC9KCR7_9PROT|nr:Integral membrane protein [Granulibacter bethesdensis]APH62544.1 Integral membrane protein [Granulibacter bethesdensis]